MPVDPATNAPASAVLAYNGDSPRGWNDPPTFTYKPGNSRPKLDLRKRVSHQQALHGGGHTPPPHPTTPTNLVTYTPPPQPTTPTNLTTYGHSHVTTAMSGLNLHAGARVPPQAPFAGYVPPIVSYTTPNTCMPVTTPVYSVPTAPLTHHPGMNGSPTSTMTPATVSSPPVIPTHPSVTSSPTVSSSAAPVHLGQPLFALKSHAFEPVKPHGHANIRATADINDTLEPHDHLTQNQPKIFNPISHAATNGSASAPILHPSPVIGHGVHESQAVLPFHPLFTPNPVVPPTSSGDQDLTAPVTCGPSLQPMSHISSSTHMGTYAPHAHITPPPGNTPGQPPHGHITPPPSSMTTPPSSHRTPPPSSTLAPPTSASGGSTPRCLSPLQTDAEDSGLSDEDGLKATIDALDDVIQKYSNQMEKRILDDISKRLKIMSQMWMSGRLSKMVKNRMIKLAKALDDGQGEEAHHIHVTIMVDHVAEVNQWMVAVKRLISLVRHDQIRPTSS